MKHTDIQLDIPALGGKKILENKVDIALAPVAVLSKISDYKLLSDYCIGAENKVHSVCLFSDVPLDKIQNIYLDHHSMTSVMLLRILLKEYWNLSPQIIDAKPGYLELIKHNTAGLAIGDKSFPLHHRYEYVYDLAETWHTYMQLPFVFAAWMTRKKIPDEFEKLLNQALAFGLNHLNEVIAENATTSLTKNELLTYYTQFISYQFSEKKKEALHVFLDKISLLQDQRNITV